MAIASLCGDAKLLCPIVCVCHTSARLSLQRLHSGRIILYLLTRSGKSHSFHLCLYSHCCRDQGNYPIGRRLYNRKAHHHSYYYHHPNRKRKRKGSFANCSEYLRSYGDQKLAVLTPLTLHLFCTFNPPLATPLMTSRVSLSLIMMLYFGLWMYCLLSMRCISFSMCYVLSFFVDNGTPAIQNRFCLTTFLNDSFALSLPYLSILRALTIPI